MSIGRLVSAVIFSITFAMFAGCQVHVAFGPTDLPANEVPEGASPTRNELAASTPLASDPVAPKRPAVSAGQIRPTTGWKPSKSQLQPNQSQIPAEQNHETEQTADFEVPIEQSTTTIRLATDSAANADIYPINLLAAMQLAGAENWDIQLAAERLREAYARLDAAKALWLPSLVAGAVYTKHDGQIQDTRGGVIDVSRNALFVGGGPVIGNSPLTGASGGPARFFVDLSLADAIFAPLVARQEVNAEHFRQSADYNTTLLTASLAYFELMRAQGQLANAQRNLTHSHELMQLTEAFVAAGKGSRADIARVRTEESNREQLVLQAEAAHGAASAELARVLRIDPATTLFALEEAAVPIEMIEPDVSLGELVARGLSQRAEIAESQNRLHASWQRVRTERLRPFIPNLYAGTSVGVFGGGRNDNLAQLDGRADFDIAAVWQVKNLGFGTKAAIERSESQYRQAIVKTYRLQDEISTEITQTYHQLMAQRQQVVLAEANKKIAMESLELNKSRIRGLEGLPLEALQSVDAVAKSERAHLDAIIDHNQSQVRILRATGNPLESQP